MLGHPNTTPDLSCGQDEKDRCPSYRAIGGGWRFTDKDMVSDGVPPNGLNFGVEKRSGPGPESRKTTVGGKPFIASH